MFKWLQRVLLLFQVTAMARSLGSSVQTIAMDPHAYTALPIAAARAVAHDRSGAAINDPLAMKLIAGETQLVRAGANVEYMTLRKQIGDELVYEAHQQGTRQIVSIGAGMDSRAFRMGLHNATFFEVDKPGLFDIKEPLVTDVPLQCAARHIVVGSVGQMDLAASLRAAGFDSTRPAVWLMEGLFPYLTVPIMKQLAADIGSLSAPGSALWGDAFSKTSVDRGMTFHGVPFESGFDNYDEMFRSAGFGQSQAVDMSGVKLDQSQVRIDQSYVLSPQTTRGRPMCLMVRAYM